MPKKRPAEFPSDWHYERHLEDLEREALGYQRRLAELDGLPDAEKAVADAESGLEAVKMQLRRFGVGQETAARRPRKAPEKAAK